MMQPRPIPPHERHGPRHPTLEFEPSHQEIMDAVLDVRERLERIERNMERR